MYFHVHLFVEYDTTVYRAYTKLHILYVILSVPGHRGQESCGTWCGEGTPSAVATPPLQSGCGVLHSEVEWGPLEGWSPEEERTPNRTSKTAGLWQVSCIQ